MRSMFALFGVLLVTLIELTLAQTTKTATVQPIGPQYISSAIVWALLCGLMLLFVLYIGIGCILSVERPVRMTAVPLQLAKEY